MDAGATPTRAQTATVFVVVPGGFAARFFLHTDIATTLGDAGVRIVVLTHDHENPALRRHAGDKDVVFEPLRRPRADRTVSWPMATAFARMLRRNALDARASPLWEIGYASVRESLRRDWPRRVSVPADLITRHLLWRSRRLRRLVLAADLMLSDHRAHADLFERYRPDLVITGSPGYYRPDEVVLQEAARRGVPSVAVIYGWDNPTTKGYKAVEPNLVVAWSERMRREVVRYHDVAPDRVVVGGVPHWDHYLAEAGLPAREEFFDRLGLDPGRRLVVFALFVPFTHDFPNRELSEALAEATAGGELGDDVQLVIRVHPNAMRPAARQDREAIEAITARHEHVFVNLPETIAEDLDHPSPEDARVLGGLIKHADVLVNVFSTTTLEACLVDTPIVMVGPTAHLRDVDEQAATGSLARIEDFQHLRPVVDSGAARIARDRRELVAHVRAYLHDGSLERDERARLAKDICGPADGAAGRRTGLLLLEQLRSAASGTPPSSLPGTILDPLAR